MRIGSAAYYPDVMIVCSDAQPPHRLYERDLSVVVEVLSTSSRDMDYREKVTVYTWAAAFETYLLADPDTRQIDACTRGKDGLVWETCTSGHVVPDVDLDVDALYDALDLTALT